MSPNSVIEQDIAQRIKGLREALGLTTKQVADMTGVTRESVDEYESGSHEVPVSFLYKMAKATGVDLTALITGTEAKLHQYSLVRKGEGLSVERRKAYQYRAMAYRFNRPSMEPFLVTIPPTPEGQAEFNQHLGEEFLFMLKGRLEATLDEDVVILEPEDTLYFSSKIPHALRAMDGQEAVILAVII